MAPSVHYVSHGEPTGYGEAGRRLLLALDAAGAEVRWTPITFDPERPWVSRDVDPFPELAHLRRRRFDADVTVVHAIPEMLPVVHRIARRGTLVSHTVWETDRLQARWSALLDAVDGVVVPTTWNQEVFRAGGVTVPVEVVPHAVRPGPPAGGAAADPTWLPPRAQPGRRGPVLCCIAEWQRRKAPWLVVESYARAFAPDDDVLLVLKTGERLWEEEVDHSDSSPERDRPSRALAQTVARLGAAPPVHLVSHWLTDAELAGLHEAADVHVSLSHGEGWDLGTFDAAVAGKATVATGWGAATELLDPGASWLVPVRLVPAPPPPGSHATSPGSGRWADPDLDAAALALRQAVAPDAQRRAAIVAQARRLADLHAGPVVAERFLDALDRIHGAATARAGRRRRRFPRSLRRSWPRSPRHLARRLVDAAQAPR
jgi:glycosyltransferase involved in cell wall biosynthesis